MKITTWVPLLALLLLAACAGNTGGGSTGTVPGDDDDDGQNPTPEPTSTIPSEKRCFIQWASSGTADGKIHVYAVELPIGEFTSGVKSFGAGNDGVLLWDHDENGNSAAEALAPSGEFELTVAGTNVGDAVSFTDDSSQSYDSGTQQGVATGGTGSFTGKIADLDSQTPEYGSGTITIEYGGSTRTLGDLGSIAGCADIPQEPQP